MVVVTDDPPAAQATPHADGAIRPTARRAPTARPAPTARRRPTARAGRSSPRTRSSCACRGACGSPCTVGAGDGLVKRSSSAALVMDGRCPHATVERHQSAVRQARREARLLGRAARSSRCASGPPRGPPRRPKPPARSPTPSPSAWSARARSSRERPPCAPRGPTSASRAHPRASAQAPGDRRGGPAGDRRLVRRTAGAQTTGRAARATQGAGRPRSRPGDHRDRRRSDRRRGDRRHRGRGDLGDLGGRGGRPCRRRRGRPAGGRHISMTTASTAT